MASKPVKLASGNWRCQVSLGKGENGKNQKKSFTAKTKKDVLRMAETFEVDYKRQKELLKTIGADAASKQKLMTLKEAMEKFLEINAPAHSASTTKGYQNLINNFYDDIADKRLIDLTNDLLQESINRAAFRKSKTTGQPLSEKTLRNAKGFLCAVLGRYYPELPVNIVIPKGMKGQRKIFMHDLDTINRILAFNKENDNCHPVELAIRLGLFGFRMNEVLGFRKQDVDFDNGIITINQTVLYQNGKKIIRPYAKTKSSMRSIKLAASVIELIQALPEEQEYLVTVTDKGLQYQWKSIQLKYGCAEDEIMSFHALRHVFASVTAQCGIADNIRQELGGWSNPTVMNGNYTHTFKDAKTEAMEKVIHYYDSAQQSLN